MANHWIIRDMINYLLPVGFAEFLRGVGGRGDEKIKLILSFCAGMGIENFRLLFYGAIFIFFPFILFSQWATRTEVLIGVFALSWFALLPEALNAVRNLSAIWIPSQSSKLLDISCLFLTGVIVGSAFFSSLWLYHELFPVLSRISSAEFYDAFKSRGVGPFSYLIDDSGLSGLSSRVDYCIYDCKVKLKHILLLMAYALSGVVLVFYIWRLIFAGAFWAFFLLLVWVDSIAQPLKGIMYLLLLIGLALSL